MEPCAPQVLTGKNVGTTTMLLGASASPTDAPSAGIPSLLITVSDSPVRAVSMVARVITTVVRTRTPRSGEPSQSLQP